MAEISGPRLTWLTNLSRPSPDFYDYIIVDEFHHAAAPTYQKLLTYYKPKILLGLTATPERMDGKSILEYFDNRIAAEIRLPEAIDRKLLYPVGAQSHRIYIKQHPQFFRREGRVVISLAESEYNR